MNPDTPFSEQRKDNAELRGFTGFAPVREDGDVTEVARCPEHGLHGERDACFVCGGPVEQVPMVEVGERTEKALTAARADQTRKVVAWLERHEHDGGGALYGSEFAALIEREFGGDSG